MSVHLPLATRLNEAARAGVTLCPPCDSAHRDSRLVAGYPWVIQWLLLADRKSTRLYSRHLVISYAVFCLKQKTGDDRLSHARVVFAAGRRRLAQPGVKQVPV